MTRTERGTAREPAARRAGASDGPRRDVSPRPDVSQRRRTADYTGMGQTLVGLGLFLSTFFSFVGPLGVLR
jgi:hypothetical protein